MGSMRYYEIIRDYDFYHFWAVMTPIIGFTVVIILQGVTIWQNWKK